MPTSVMSPRPASAGKIMETAIMYEWTCHVCALGGMEAVTQQKCANCTHYRCPDCTIEKIEIQA